MTPIVSRHSAADLRAMIEMAEDALSRPNNPNAEKLTALVARYREELAGATGDRSVYDVAGDSHPRAGSPAKNQYGTSQVHAASERQIAFVKRLVAEKDTAGVKIPADLDHLGKTHASALIDQLINRPAKATAAPEVKMASEKQQAFIGRLAAERDWAGVVDGLDIDTRSIDPSRIPARVASKVIDTLLAAPRVQATPAAPAVELAPGAYCLADGRIVRVYLGQQSGKMLAQQLADPTAETRDEAWHYLGMASRFVPADARRMTVEECEAASAGTADHGWCCVCGRELDDPTSVARGIGPVCRAKQGAMA